MTINDKLILWMNKQTGTMREAVGESADKEVQAIRKLVGSFGCQSAHVAALVAIYTGKPVRNPDRVCVPQGGVVVVLKREGAHNYPLNKPVMRVQGGRFLAYKRGAGPYVGNHLPLRLGGDIPTVRPATDEEVREFVKVVGVDEIRKHLCII